MPFLTDFHKSIWFFVVVLPLALGFLFKTERTRGFLILLAVGTLVGFVDYFNYNMIKLFVDRKRPEFIGLNPTLRTHSHSGPSFPSNHAANIFAIMTFLSLLYPKKAPYFISFAIIVSYSRIYVGVHFPLDVLAGAMVGASMAFLFFLFFRRVESRTRLSRIS